MPQINRLRFKYDPVDGGLYLDAFRKQFYTERLGDVQDTLQYLCFAAGVVRQVEGEVRFSTAVETPPHIRDLRYHDPAHRRKLGDPFPDTEVALWDDPLPERFD